jgi:hypothetical protein
MKPLKVLIWIGAGVGFYLVVSFGFDMLNSYMKAKAYAAVKAEFEEKLRKADEKIVAGKEKYAKLSEQAGRERETLRLSAAEALRKAAFNFEKYKSRSAEELAEKQATIAEVLVEKRKDEAAIVEAKASIDYLGTLYFMTLKVWAISDENKDRTHGEIVGALEEKYVMCDRWRKLIEDKLRPTFWKRAKRAGELALAFGAGYATGRAK